MSSRPFAALVAGSQSRAKRISHKRPSTLQRSFATALSPRRGGSDSTVTRTCRATGEALLAPVRNHRRRVSSLQTWTYKPQNRQDVSAFALTYSLRLRSCKSMDAFCHLVLAFPIEGDVTNRRAHWDRNRARPAVGGGFPFPLFRLRGGFTVPPWLRFPRPPYNPGRPDFPGPV